MPGQERVSQSDVGHVENACRMDDRNHYWSSSVQLAPSTAHGLAALPMAIFPVLLARPLVADSELLPCIPCTAIYFYCHPRPQTNWPQVRANLACLLQRLHADLHVVPEEAVQEVLPNGTIHLIISNLQPTGHTQVAPSPVEQVRSVEPRAVDREMKSALLGMGVSTALRIGVNVCGEGAVDREMKSALLEMGVSTALRILGVNVCGGHRVIGAQ